MKLFFVCKLDTDSKSLIENIFWNFLCYIEIAVIGWIFQHVLNFHFVIISYLCLSGVWLGDNCKVQ